MRGITNNWFKSFIKDRYCDIQMLQNVALMQCSVHHFADDTNLLFIDKSLKNINKHIHHTWSIFSNGSRTSLNVGKTKIIIFRNRFQQIKKLDFRVIKKKNQFSSVKYLGIHLIHIHMEHLSAWTYTKTQLSSWSAIYDKTLHI